MNRSNIRRLARVLALGAILAVLPACLASRPADAADAALGPIRQHNPSEPLHALEKIELDELWRLGGENESDEEIFGRVADILVDERGEVYFLDGQLDEVRVFSPDGVWLRRLGRPGEGPGEFRNATTEFFLPDDRIAVVQSMPTRVVTMDRNGAGLADLPLPGLEESSSVMVQRAESRGELIVLSYTAHHYDEANIYIDRRMIAMDPSGRELATLREESEAQPHGQPVRVNPVEGKDNYFQIWALGADGRVYAAPHYQSYSIYALDSAGGIPRVIERDYDSVPRDEKLLDELRESQQEFRRRFGIQGEEDPISPFERDISRVVARNDGELWVLSSRGIADSPPGALGIFDVFDSGARFTRQLVFDVDYDSRYDEFRIVGDRLFILKEAKAGTDEVSSGAGGRLRLVRRVHSAPEEEREARPFEIVCYAIPQGV